RRVIAPDGCSIRDTGAAALCSWTSCLANHEANFIDDHCIWPARQQSLSPVQSLELSLIYWLTQHTIGCLHASWLNTSHQTRAASATPNGSKSRRSRAAASGKRHAART